MPNNISFHPEILWVCTPTKEFLKNKIISLPHLKGNEQLLLNINKYLISVQISSCILKII